MNKKLLSSRRNTRENLLMLFYSREFLQRDFRISADEALSFLRSIKDFKTDENVELIRDSIKEVFDNVRITKLDPEDIIEFPVPFLKEKISMTFQEMDEENVRDSFLTRSVELADTFKSIKHVQETEVIAEENKDNLAFFTEYVNLYFINLDRIDTEIKKNLENWDFGRISIIDKIILRMGIVELKFLLDIPS
ncbi:MAG: transcription antitermination factor NusB, partial [Candidatus Delongbacteria bacterium]